jgi:peptidoglycan hydrolase CwlO-like protein
MTCRQLEIIALSAAIAGAAVVSAGASAQPSLHLEQHRQQVARAQVERLKEVLARSAERYDGARWRLGIAEHDARLATLLIANARQQLRIGRRRAAAQVVALYESGDTAGVADVVLGATSVQDALDRLHFVDAASRARARTVAQLQAAQAELVGQGQRLVAVKRTRAAEVRALGAERGAIAAQLDQRRRALAMIDGNVARLEAAQQRREAQLARADAKSPVLPSDPTFADPSSGEARPVSGAQSSGAVAIALQYLGVPYQWGGATPAGFDCSGFVMYVFNQF